MLEDDELDTWPPPELPPPPPPQACDRMATKVSNSAFSTALCPVCMENPPQLSARLTYGRNPVTLYRWDCESSSTRYPKWYTLPNTSLIATAATETDRFNCGS